MVVDIRCAAAALLCLAGSCGAASAHVSLEAKQAKVGAGYKAVLGVPHGCQGSPTTEVIVDIPEGVVGVKPMPKPGWTLSLQKGPYARSYAFHHGETKSDGVKQVTWSGGSLPDEYFDQFVLSTFIAGELEPGSKLYFPVTQKCVSGEQRWSEVPAEGQDAHSLEHPAPQVILVAREEKHDHAEKAAAPPASIEVVAAWTRPAASAGGIGAGYMKITNNGTEADVLTGGSSDAAERVEVHETAIDDKGVASMKKLDAVELQSGQSIELKPAGIHIMLIGLKQPLKEGDTLKAQLNFRKAGKVDVEFAVKTAGGDEAGGHMHHQH
ncbi:MAG TPA: DUF1775 domain-containing protein [Hyphomicrobium sp.]|jgi:hypothetical protein